MVNAEYIRVWDWGQFNFRNYGKNTGHSVWRKKTAGMSNEVYNKTPDVAYYEKLLGKR